MKNPIMVILFAGLIAAVVVLGFKLIRDLKVFRQFARAIISSVSKFNPLLTLSVVWCASYLMFLLFFLPQNTFYRLFYLPALILLLGIFLHTLMASSGYRRKLRTALLVTIMAIFNLFFLIFPYSRIEGNPPLALALKMQQSWPPRTVIYYSELNSDDMIVRYFNPQATWKRLEIDARAVPDREMREVYLSGGSAWINTVTLDFLKSHLDGDVWLREHTREQRKIELVDRKHRIQYFQIFPIPLESTPNNSFNRGAD